MGCLKLHILDKQYKRTELRVSYFNKKLTQSFCADNLRRWTLVSRIDPDGRADFWFDGRMIGNDGIDDQRIMALKTTEKSFSEGEHKVDGAGLSRKDQKATVNFIKANSGNAEAFQKNGMAYTNSVAIESSATNRQAMIKEVSRDDGRGGTSDANNREYGGSIQNGNVVAAEPGPVSNPAVGGASIMLPTGYPKYHGHPSGTRSESVEGGTRNSSFNQPPSPTDINNAGGYTNYVFGRGDGMVYIYNSTGVQAVIPMQYFVNPRR